MLCPACAAASPPPADVSLSINAQAGLCHSAVLLVRSGAVWHSQHASRLGTLASAAVTKAPDFEAVPAISCVGSPLGDTALVADAATRQIFTRAPRTVMTVAANHQMYSEQYPRQRPACRKHELVPSFESGATHLAQGEEHDFVEGAAAGDAQRHVRLLLRVAVVACRPVHLR